MREQPKDSSRFRNVIPDDPTARLERLAEVRRSVVARGKALIADPNYPDKKTVGAVARLLARHLER